MSIGETTITLVGNLTSDPDLRFTPNGVGVASFTVASTPRRFDKETGRYVDGDTLFLRCSAWRELGDHVAESLTKGARVIVSGRLRQRSFETQEGEQRTVLEVDVDEVGPSLRFATAKVTKTSRAGGPQAPHPADLDEPWAAAPTATAGVGASDEPPF